LKTKVPKTATGGHSGLWGSARARTQVRRDVDGRLHCLPRRLRPRRILARPGHGRSRCWAWMLIAPSGRTISRAHDVRRFLADRLMSILALVETPEWVWFEDGLAYDNARLPQALIVTGMATKMPGYVDAGLRSLRWLMTQQTSSAGHFRPVGTAGFGEHRQHPRAFDQQPWKRRRQSPHAWRLGGRTAIPAGKRPRAALSSGFSAATICRWRWSISTPGAAATDCTPDRANENCGGESVVCYLLGRAEIRQLARVNSSLTKTAALRAAGHLNFTPHSEPRIPCHKPPS